MNYIKEINAFYLEIETNPLSTGAGMLWHTLLHINNRAHWVEEFSVAAAVVCYKSGLSNSSFKRARTELQKKGYIAYRSRGTKAPIYRMISLVKGRNIETEVEQVDEEVSQVVGEELNQVADQQVSPLYKKDETKQKETKTISSFVNRDLYRFYSKNFFKPSDYIRRELITWSNQVGEELVYEALKRSLANGVATWHYAKGILKRWQQDQLRTVADVLVAEDRYRERRRLKSSTYKPDVPKEIVPDWFRELKEKQRKERELQG